jgi:hypothetical protein
MSLLKELKPEIKALIDADKKSYPNLIGTIEKELNNNYAVGDITVGVASNLIDYLGNTDLNPNTDNFMLKLYFIFGR